MINEEDYYTEDGSSSLNNGESQGSDMGYDEDEEFCRFRKEQIFQEIDFTKRKSKIVCTLGYVTINFDNCLGLTRILRFLTSSN
jgi:hypothetical protein